MSDLPAEVVKVVDVLKRALGINDELTTQGPPKEWPDHYGAQTVAQRWDAGPISVTTSGYGPDPSGYSGGEQSWIVSIESVGFSLSMYLHDYAGWSAPVVLTKDPRNAPILDALVTSGVRYDC